MNRIFFLHIPRCAGTTLHVIMDRQYTGLGEVYTVPSVAWNSQNFRSLREEWSQEKKDLIKVVKGHMVYGWHHAFGGDDFTYITMLRDPVECGVSLYHYVLQSGSAHFLYDKMVSDPFDTFARIGNAQVRAVSGMMNSQSTYALEMAKAHLMNSFSVVGLVEHFDESLRWMQDAFGWQDVEYTPLNIAERRAEPPPGLRRHIEDVDCLDRELYEFAKKEFWE